MEKIFYSISEVAQQLSETVVTVRFWTNTFSRYLEPHRNAKGNRMYKEKDIEILRRVHYLTRDCGLSLEAVGHKLSKSGRGEDKTLEIRESLLRIRAKLLQIRESLS